MIIVWLQSVFGYLNFHRLEDDFKAVVLRSNDKYSTIQMYGFSLTNNYTEILRNFLKLS